MAVTYFWHKQDFGGTVWPFLDSPSSSLSDRHCRVRRQRTQRLFFSFYFYVILSRQGRPTFHASGFSYTNFSIRELRLSCLWANCFNNNLLKLSFTFTGSNSGDITVAFRCAIVWSGCASVCLVCGPVLAPESIMLRCGVCMCKLFSIEHAMATLSQNCGCQTSELPPTSIAVLFCAVLVWRWCWISLLRTRDPPKHPLLSKVLVKGDLWLCILTDRHLHPY